MTTGIVAINCLILKNICSSPSRHVLVKLAGIHICLFSRIENVAINRGSLDRTANFALKPL